MESKTIYITVTDDDCECGHSHRAEFDAIACRNRRQAKGETSVRIVRVRQGGR